VENWIVPLTGPAVVEDPDPALADVEPPDALEPPQAASAAAARPAPEAASNVRRVCGSESLSIKSIPYLGLTISR
jgi:hypothetical protein